MYEGKSIVSEKHFHLRSNIKRSPNTMFCVIDSAIHEPRLPKERRLSLSSTGEYIIAVAVSLFEWPVEGDVSVDWVLFTVGLVLNSGWTLGLLLGVLAKELHLKTE